jgi:hypothetical protein
MPGYGVVRFDKSARTITAECWPRYVEPQLATDDQQYEGWPRTVAMANNFNKEAVAYLPMIEVENLENPVFQVWQGEELVYSIRPGVKRFRGKVFVEGEYLVKVGNPETERWQELQMSSHDNIVANISF